MFPQSSTVAAPTQSESVRVRASGSVGLAHAMMLVAQLLVHLNLLASLLKTGPHAHIKDIMLQPLQLQLHLVP